MNPSLPGFPVHHQLVAVRFISACSQFVQFSSVLHSYQSLCKQWTAACQASLSTTISQSLLKLMSIELVMPYNHLILCLPLIFLPSVFPYIRVFSNESVLPNRWANNWSFNFSITSSSEYAGLISFRMDSFDLLAVQRTLKSLLQGKELRWHRNRTGRPLSPPQIH